MKKKTTLSSFFALNQGNNQDKKTGIQKTQPSLKRNHKDLMAQLIQEAQEKIKPSISSKDSILGLSKNNQEYN